MKKTFIALMLIAGGNLINAQVRTTATTAVVTQTAKEAAPAVKQAAIVKATPAATNIAVKNAGTLQKGKTVVKKTGTISNSVQPGTKSDQLIQQGSGLVK